MPKLNQSTRFAFLSIKNGISGWVVKDSALELENLTRNPQLLLNVPPSQVLRDKPKIKVVKQTFTTQNNGGKCNVVIKRFQYRSFWRRIWYLFLPSPAIQCLRGTLLLIEHGIGTAFPLAALEHRDWYHLGTSYYITEEVKESQSIDAFWAYTLPSRSKEKRLRERWQVLKEVASLFHRLHSCGIYHPDLKGANILVRKQEIDSWQCLLVDVIGLRKKRTLSLSRRIKNLIQLERTFGQHLSNREKIYLLKQYSELFSLSRKQRRDLATKVLPVGR